MSQQLTPSIVTDLRSMYQPACRSACLRVPHRQTGRQLLQHQLRIATGLNILSGRG